MRPRSKGVIAVLGFTSVSMLALASMGLMEWVSASLFLMMEFLAGSVKAWARRRRPHRHAHRPLLAAVHPRPRHARDVGHRPPRLIRRPMIGRLRGAPNP